MTVPARLAAIAAAALLAGPATTEDTTRQPPGAPAGPVIIVAQADATAPALPASFVGTLPEASGPGIAWRLDMWPDGAFHLRRTYGAAPDAPVFTLGRWRRADGANVLSSAGREIARLRAIDARTLELLDPDGAPVGTRLDMRLRGDGALRPTPMRATLAGRFVYMADAALFTPCLTGLRLPVAMEGAYPALERAYLDARPAPGAEVVAWVDSRIEQREQMEGPARPTLIVDRLVGLRPGEACEQNLADAPLLETYWRILVIDGEPAPRPEGAREARLALRAEDGRFSASAGCNTILGGHEIDGDSLRLRPGPMTLMACPPPLDAAERALIDALGRVARWRVDGPWLELRDADGAVALRAEAVVLR